MTLLQTSLDSSTLTAEYWTEQRFLQEEEAWQALLEESKADPLFMSWQWMSNWWSLRKSPSSELKIIAVYKADRLVALAPLYSEPVFYCKGLIKSHCLQFIGKRARGSSGVRAEYLSFILSNDFKKEALETIFKFIGKNIQWSEWCFDDVDTTREDYYILSSWLKDLPLYQRVEKTGVSYAVNCTGNFESYCQSLGKNSRLKLLNRRKLIESMGQVEIRWLDNSHFDEFLDTMNHWHQDRWHHDAFIGKNYEFLKSLNSNSKTLDFSYSSMLLLDNKPLSVMINVRSAQAIYNIQIGYDESFDKRISLGKLHIGYVLEAAFEDQNTVIFDFLEGDGKNENYKSHIAAPYKTLESVKWVRNPLLKGLFQTYDKFLQPVRLKYFVKQSKPAQTIS